MFFHCFVTKEKSSNCTIKYRQIWQQKHKPEIRSNCPIWQSKPETTRKMYYIYCFIWQNGNKLGKHPTNCTVYTLLHMITRKHAKKGKKTQASVLYILFSHMIKQTYVKKQNKTPAIVLYILCLIRLNRNISLWKKKSNGLYIILCSTKQNGNIWHEKKTTQIMTLIYYINLTYNVYQEISASERWIRRNSCQINKYQCIMRLSQI